MLVWPKNDVMRKALKHPHNNVAFRDEGPIDWPDDSFTHRRIADGDVLTEDPSPSKTIVAAAPVAVVAAEKKAARPLPPEPSKPFAR